MKCPYCGCLDTQVKDSRPSEDGSNIRRRRHCPKCTERFTTVEHVQLREFTVVKKTGISVPFDRDKLYRSLVIALRKREVDIASVERLVNSIVHELEQLGDGEIPSSKIGELVMAALAKFDKVAYIRYASVYKNFASTQDFEDFVATITSSPKNIRKK